MGFEVWGFEFHVSGSGSRVDGPGLRIYALWFMIQGSGTRVQIQGSRFRASCFGFRVSGSGMKGLPGFGFWVLGFVFFRVQN